MRYRYWTLLFPLFLEGCSFYNEEFECEPGVGVGCKSLSQVNRMVDAGKLPLVTTNEEETEIVTPPHTPLPVTSHLRAWVAGHTDEDGNMISPTFIDIPLTAHLHA